MAVIGSAAVEITAQTTALEKEITSAITRAANSAPAAAVKAQTTGLEKDIHAGVKRAASSAPAVNVKADTKEAQGAISGFFNLFKSKAEGFAGQSNIVTKSLKNIESAGFDVSKATVGIGAGLAVGAAAIAAFAAAGIQHFRSLAGEIRRFSSITGASAEESSKFVVALHELGVEPDAVGRGFFKLSQAIGKNADALAKNGIEIQKTKDGSVDLTATFLDIADKVHNATSATQANTIAFTAFGRAGLSLLPVLKKGSEGLQEFLDIAGKRGEIFTQEELTQAKNFDISLRSLKGSIEALEISAGKGLVPALTSVVNQSVAFLDVVNRLTAPIGGLAGIIGGVFRTGLSSLSGGMSEVVRLFVDGKEKTDTIAGAQERAGAAFAQTAEEIQAEESALTALLSAMQSAISSDLALQSSDLARRQSIVAVETAQRSLTTAIQEHGAKSNEARDAAFALEGANINVRESFLREADAAVKLASDQAAATNQQLTATEKAGIFRAKLTELARTTSGPLHDAIVDYIKKLGEIPEEENTTIKVDAAEAAATLKKIIELENAIDRNINIQVHAGNAVNGGQLSGQASGGPVFKDTPVIVGERGAELFVPSSNGQIVKHSDLIAATRSAPATVVTTAASSAPIVQNVTVNEVASDPNATAAAVAARLGDLVTR